MTSACFSRGHTGFSRNATLVATVNPPALAGGVFNLQFLLRVQKFESRSGEKVYLTAIHLAVVHSMHIY